MDRLLYELPLAGYDQSGYSSPDPGRRSRRTGTLGHARLWITSHAFRKTTATDLDNDAKPPAESPTTSATPASP